MTRDAAEIVLQILHGERVQDIPRRESVRYSDGRLAPVTTLEYRRRPASAEHSILYKERSFWDVYKWHILGILSISILEAALIVALLIQQARRRQAKKRSG